jgi:heat shock protein HslJ
MIKSINSKVILTLILMFGFSLASKSEVIKLVIKEDLASCTGVAPMTCMQVKYKNSKNWELFYDQISGFKYKPGYRYVILVDRAKRKNVPADASIYEYKLKRVVQKTKIKVKTNTAWDYVLKHKWKLIQMNGVTQTSSPVYITFDGEKKRVTGKSGCNTFFGGYDKSEETLIFKQMAGTRMACSEELNKLEHQFLTLIGDKSFKFDVAEQTLNLYQNNKLVLMFGAAAL